MTPTWDGCQPGFPSPTQAPRSLVIDLAQPRGDHHAVRLILADTWESTDIRADSITDLVSIWLTVMRSGYYTYQPDQYLWVPTTTEFLPNQYLGLA